MATVIPFTDLKKRFVDWWNLSELGMQSWRDDLRYQVVESFVDCGNAMFSGAPIAYCNTCYRLFITPENESDAIYCSGICEEAQRDL